MVPVIVIAISFAGDPAAIEGIVQGKDVQAPVTPVIVKFVGISVITTFVATSGPLLETTTS